MKKIFINGTLISLIVLILMLVIACQGNFDTYYKKNPDSGVLMEYLEGQPQYSEFVTLLKKTGYDISLSQNNPMTVFAPENGHWGNVLSMSNKDSLRKIVGMNIAYSQINLSKTNGRIQTITDKYFDILRVGEQYRIGGIVVQPQYKTCMNGYIYSIANPITPLKSMYEFILDNPKYALMKSTIDRTNAAVFDDQLSTFLRYDSLARPVYDTVTVIKNGYLTNVPLNVENASSTLFLPTDDAVRSTLGSDFKTRVLEARGAITRGDTLSFFDNLYRHIVVTSGVYSQETLTGSNNFNSVINTTFNITKDAISSGNKPASNGIIHEVKDLKGSLVDYLFQRPVTVTSGLVDSLKLDVLTIPGQVNKATIVRSNLIGGKRYFKFTCKINSNVVNFPPLDIDFGITIPKVAPGIYIVLLNYYCDANGGTFNLKLDDPKSTSTINQAPLYASFVKSNVIRDKVMGKIEVKKAGNVTIYFDSIGYRADYYISNSTSNNNCELNFENIKLVPIPSWNTNL
jgi:hypothetical protein